MDRQDGRRATEAPRAESVETLVMRALTERAAGDYAWLRVSSAGLALLAVNP